MMRMWRRRWASSRSQSSRSPAVETNRPRLTLETLEARDVPAVTLVSFAASGTASASANNDSTLPFVATSISDDGNYVVYLSQATNLVTNQSDTNGVNDVFLFDRANNTTRLISRQHGTTATAANGESFAPVISADGKWVAFFNSGTNLVENFTSQGSGYQVYLYSVENDSLTLVTRKAGATGNVGIVSSDIPQQGQIAISNDGSFIAYISDTYDLVANYSTSENFWTQAGYLPVDAYLYNRHTGTNTLVSHVPGSPSRGANDWTTLVTISGGSTYNPTTQTASGTVVFSSSATNLVSNQDDNTSTLDIFRYDIATGTTSLVTHAPTDTKKAVASSSDQDLFPASVSDDGKFITYASRSRNLVANQSDSIGTYDVFVYDVANATTTLVSRTASSATTAAGATYTLLSGNFPLISGDGKWITFVSASNNLLSPSLSGNATRVYLYEVATGEITLVSRNSETGAAVSGTNPSISNNGRYVAYISTTSAPDVYVFDRTDNSVKLISHRTTSETTPTGGGNTLPRISGNGNVIAWTSTASTLVANDNNNKADVFINAINSGHNDPEDPDDGPQFQLTLNLDNADYAQFQVPVEYADQNFQFALVSGAGDADNFQFRLSPDGRLTLSDNFQWVPGSTEFQENFQIRVRLQGNTITEEMQFQFVLPKPPTAIGIDQFQLPPWTDEVMQFQTIGPSSETYQFQLVPGAGSDDNEQFQIVNGKLMRDTDFVEDQFTYLVRVRQQSTRFPGYYYDEQFTFVYKFTLSQNVVEAKSNVSVGSFAVPGSSRSYTYRLVSGSGDTDNGQFTISGNTLLTASNFPLQTANYSIRVRATDTQFQQILAEMVFTITAVIPPTDITPSSWGVPNAANAEVATLTTTGDPNGTYTYELVSGAGDTDNGLFTIVGDKLVTKDGFTTNKDTFSIRVRTTDATYSQFSYEEALTLVIQPTIQLSNTAITAGPNVTVGTLTTPNSSRSYTFSLVPGAGDNAHFTLVGNTLATVNTFPLSTANYNVVIRATDADSAYSTVFSEQTFTIAAADPNPPPATPILNVPSSLVFTEGSAVAANIAAAPGDTNSIVTVTVSGVPANVSFSAGVNNGDGTWTFTLSQLSGLLISATDSGSFTLTVTATAARAGSTRTASATATITVTVLNAAPTVTVEAPLTFNPRLPLSIRVSANDVGQDTIQSVTINWGDGTVQTFPGLPGTYTHRYPIANRPYTITVTVTDEDGSYTTVVGGGTAARLETASQAEVAGLYLDLLGREVDDTGLNDWSALLDAGVPLQQVIAGILGSVEYRERIVRELYIRYLDRLPDPQGLAFHVELYATGGERAVKQSILASEEFFLKNGGTNASFLAALYLAVLEREIDPWGEAEFLRVLNFGASRAEVVRIVLDSAEGVANQVSEAYELFLGRAADAGGMASWTNFAMNDPARFLVEFLSSEEYVQRWQVV
ncbi:MAG: DUF4214 domain-containing protein [Gemmataceae bacterium]|nr:DUF4214 domain-containing protein [Gemmata sp.]MDW8198324.1 DUF4214 domain-containing protein [Gemmataceae bacterium]